MTKTEDELTMIRKLLQVMVGSMFDDTTVKDVKPTIAVAATVSAKKITKKKAPKKKVVKK